MKKTMILFLIALLIQGCAKSTNAPKDSGLTGNWTTIDNNCSNGISQVKFLSENTIVVNESILSNYNYKTGSEFLNNYWINAGWPDRATYNKLIVSDIVYSISTENQTITLKNDQNNCTTKLSQGPF